MLKTFLLFHVFIIPHSWMGKKQLRPFQTHYPGSLGLASSIIYRNHAALCSLNEIISLMCFLFQTILAMVRNLPLSI